MASRFARTHFDVSAVDFVFPVGIMYTGILLFYIGLIISGDWRKKLDNVRSNPLLVPILLLSVVSGVIGLTQNKPPEIAQEFWPGFGHYQTYLFYCPI